MGPMLPYNSPVFSSPDNSGEIAETDKVEGMLTDPLNVVSNVPLEVCPKSVDVVPSLVDVENVLFVVKSREV